MSGLRLDPVEGILAVLNEGAATGTNKFGLLLALIDLAPTVGSDRSLPVSLLAEKLLELHWDHARPYAGEVLRQVTSGNRANSTVVLEVGKLQELVGSTLPYERARSLIPDDAWRTAVANVTSGTVKNPLRYLQRLPGNPAPFLYATERATRESPTKIRFLDGAVEALVRYGPVLRDLIQFRFVRFVAAANRKVVGTPVEDQIAEHLFGEERHMPPPAMRRQMWELQRRRCVYTGIQLADPTKPHSNTSADHVIPWARVRISAAENFLLTAVQINSTKKDMLLSPRMLSQWVNHLETHADSMASTAEAFGWPTDLNRVMTVATAQYRHASPATPSWCAVNGVAVLGEKGISEALTILASTS